MMKAIAPITGGMKIPPVEAQASIAAGSKTLGSALTLNQGLLEDSLQVVERSVSFFNRLFNPNDTYGMAVSLVARRGGSRRTRVAQDEGPESRHRVLHDEGNILRHLVA